jgi:hypothetical protein
MFIIIIPCIFCHLQSITTLVNNYFIQCAHILFVNSTRCKCRYNMTPNTVFCRYTIPEVAWPRPYVRFRNRFSTVARNHRTRCRLVTRQDSPKLENENKHQCPARHSTPWSQNPRIETNASDSATTEIDVIQHFTLQRSNVKYLNLTRIK